MGDYRNCAPPPSGVNFQPPVPDTTFGTMSHVYIPRFDAACTAGSPVSSYPMPIQMVQPSTCTVLVPKTFYVNGYTYYASAIR